MSDPVDVREAIGAHAKEALNPHATAADRQTRALLAIAAGLRYIGDVIAESHER